MTKVILAEESIHAERERGMSQPNTVTQQKQSRHAARQCVSSPNESFYRYEYELCECDEMAGGLIATVAIGGWTKQKGR